MTCVNFSITQDWLTTGVLYGSLTGLKNFQFSGAGRGSPDIFDLSMLKSPIAILTPRDWENKAAITARPRMPFRMPDRIAMMKCAQLSSSMKPMKDILARAIRKTMTADMYSGYFHVKKALSTDKIGKTCSLTSLTWYWTVAKSAFTDFGTNALGMPGMSVRGKTSFFRKMPSMSSSPVSQSFSSNLTVTFWFGPSGPSSFMISPRRRSFTRTRSPASCSLLACGRSRNQTSWRTLRISSYETSGFPPTSHTRVPAKCTRSCWLSTSPSRA
mmetsp:Transcript_61823/g.109785  ORF Transcript_61823/g.109785 Transcript_61823/m.109785 type:complete len:271 (-) Transcript_61823:1493-2305(-)